MINNPSSTNEKDNENERQRLTNNNRMRLVKALLHEEVKHLIWLSQEILTRMELDGRNNVTVLKYNYYFQVAEKLNSA